MAHFAKLNSDNIVLEVHVVANEALDSSNEEASGIAFLTEWSGGYTNWKQTSYNAARKGFRKHYAGIGFTYNPALDAFLAPKPYASWVLNPATCSWDAPTPRPNDGEHYDWSEEEKQWVVGEEHS